MKNILKNKILLILIVILCVFIAGCGESGGETPEPNKNYNEANYTFNMTASFEKELTLEELKATLNKASEYFAVAKSYSYTIKMSGEYDSQYSYEGVTKIDVTGATPLASVELVGSTNNSLYIANNKAYFNYNGYKTVYDVKSDLSDLINNTQESLGVFVSFDSDLITIENLVFAGVDKDDSTVIKYNVSAEARVIIVINGDKIMKVLYSNDSSVEYIANYDYNPVTITLPSDLDSYVNE